MTRNNISRKRKRGSKGLMTMFAPLQQQNRVPVAVEDLGNMHMGRPEVRDVPKFTIRRDKVYTISRAANPTSVLQSTTTDSLGALQFSLSQLPNYTEFTNLFDQYRIKQVVVRFVPNSDSSSGGPLITVLDYDDANVPTQTVNLLEYENMVLSGPGQLVERVIEPCAAPAMYTGSFTGFGSSVKNQWMDSASPTIAYYGLKYSLAANTAGTTQNSYSVFVTMIVQFRNTR